MKIKFDIFEVNENGIKIHFKDSLTYDIASHRLWETQNFEDWEVWSWLIHLADKTWITQENYNYLNTAFFFAQDYFKNENKNFINNASTFQTLNIQKQMMDKRLTRSKNRNDNNSGFVRMDLEKLRERRESEPPILLITPPEEN